MAKKKRNLFSELVEGVEAMARDRERESEFSYPCKCIRVIDGDTLELEIDLGFHVFIREKARLKGINTPETYGVKKTSDEYKRGMKAKNRLKELIKGKRLSITTYRDKKGKYGRYIVDLYYYTDNNQCVYINGKLVKEGLAEEVNYGR